MFGSFSGNNEAMMGADWFVISFKDFTAYRGDSR